MNINKLTPDTLILAELGTRLARLRKQRGYSQQKLATEAGLGVATLRRIEAGDGSQIDSWLKLLKALDMISGINDFLPENLGSPMAENLGSPISDVLSGSSKLPCDSSSGKQYSGERN